VSASRSATVLTLTSSVAVVSVGLRLRPPAWTKSFVLRLKKRSYRFVWDPHSGIMHGSFKVS
jgi:hypothetical protein